MADDPRRRAVTAPPAVRQPLARRGPGLVEYAPIAVLAAIAVVVVVLLMGHQIRDAVMQVVRTLQGP